MVEVDKVSPVGAGSVSAGRQGALVAEPRPRPAPTLVNTNLVITLDWPSRPRRNPLRNSVSSNDAVCRTELGEEATKTRVKTDTAEPPLALLSDMNNKELAAAAPDIVNQTMKLFGANLGDRTEVERRQVGDDI